MKISRTALAALALTSALSQADPRQADRAPLPLNFAAMLDLDTTRALVVEAILESAYRRAIEAREQIGRPTDETLHAVTQAAMRAICDDADRQLASVLTPEELTKLKDLMAPRENPRARAEWNPT